MPTATFDTSRVTELWQTTVKEARVGASKARTEAQVHRDELLILAGTLLFGLVVGALAVIGLLL